MKWPARCLIHKVAPKGEVLVDDGSFVATDGNMIVQVPFEGTGPPSGATLHSKQIEHATKGRGKRNPMAEGVIGPLRDFQFVAADGSRLTPEYLSGENHPRMHDVEEPNEFITLRISATLLAKAAAAMGTDCVELRIPRDEFVVNRPLVIRPVDGGRDGEAPLDGAKAILGVVT